MAFRDMLMSEHRTVSLLLHRTRRGITRPRFGIQDSEDRPQGRTYLVVWSHGQADPLRTRIQDIGDSRQHVDIGHHGTGFLLARVGHAPTNATKHVHTSHPAGPDTLDVDLGRSPSSLFYWTSPTLLRLDPWTFGRNALHSSGRASGSSGYGRPRASCPVYSPTFPQAIPGIRYARREHGYGRGGSYVTVSRGLIGSIFWRINEIRVQVRALPDDTHGYALVVVDGPTNPLVTLTTAA